MTMNGMLRKNLPVIPGTRAKGMKAMIVVMTANVTGASTSRVPTIAASSRLSPRRW